MVGVALPFTSVMCCRVRPKSVASQFGLSKLRMRTAPPPSRVILLPPSMTVFFVIGTFNVTVTGIVTGAAPQLNVMTPPAVAAVCSAANVQLAAVPVPITAVGFDVSAGWPFAGTPALHEPFGLPAPPIEDEPPLPPAGPVPPPRPLPPPPSGACDDPELQPNETSATGTTRAEKIRMRHLAVIES